MCQPRILHEDRLGYISRCQECGRLQLAFGTSAFAMTPDEFREFSKQARLYHSDHFDRIDRNRKDIYVPAMQPGIYLVLTAQELEDLINLLDMGLAGLEIDEAFRFI